MEENKIKTADKLGNSIKFFILNSVVLIVFWVVVYFGFSMFFVRPLYYEVQNEIPEWGVPVSQLQVKLDLYNLISIYILNSLYIFISIPSISYIISLRKQKENYKKPFFTYLMIFELIFAFFLFSLSILYFINLNFDIIISEIFTICKIFLVLGKVGSSIFLFLAIKDEFFESFTEDKSSKLKKYMIIMVIGSFYTMFFFMGIVMILLIPFLIGILLVGYELRKKDSLILSNQPTNSSLTSL